MAKAVWFGILAALACASSAFAAPDGDKFAGIDRQFVCPEALRSDEARLEALRSFFNNVGAAAPDQSIVDVLLYRKLLLKKHNCEKTLQSMAAAEAAVRNGDVLDQAWFPVGGNKTVTLSASSNTVKSFDDPRYPGDHAIDIYMNLQFASPQETNVTHVSYDQVITHNIYYCRANRYALVENDYFLAGKSTFKDPSKVAATLGGIDVYQVTPIPPGSFNEMAAVWACTALNGQPG